MAQRDDRIDFLRGFALLAIFADHVPQNPLSLLTPRSFAYCDAAELFFFLSGFTAALVYMRHMKAAGLLQGAVRIWRRAGIIYLAQLVLFACVAAEVAALAAGLGRHDYFDIFRLGPLFNDPGAALPALALLKYQPGYLDILPVYFLFFLALPLVLAAAARNVWFVVVPSLLVYAGVQVFGWSLRSYPWNEIWMFNPFAWQFLFVLGVAFGTWRMRLPDWLSLTAVVVAAAAAVLQFTVALHDFIPAVPALKIAALWSSKPDLGWPRLASFLLLAAAARYLPARGVCERRFPAVTRCGRHSLPVFCLGTVLAVIGAVSWELSGHVVVVQALVGLVGVAVLLAFAALLERVKLAEWSAGRSGRQISDAASTAAE